MKCFGPVPIMRRALLPWIAPVVEMIGSAFKARREMEYLLSGASELTRSRRLTQLVGDLSIMLGTGHTRPHHGA